MGGLADKVGVITREHTGSRLHEAKRRLKPHATASAALGLARCQTVPSGAMTVSTVR